MSSQARRKAMCGVARVGTLLTLAACLAGPAAAQTSIQVVDSNGLPIPSVRVESYGRGELLTVASTSVDGLVEIPADAWSRLRRVSLSHLGFQTLIVQADELPADGVLRMVTEATEIAGLTVEGRELCPVVPSAEARRMWAEVAALYSGDTGYRALSTRYSRRSGSVTSGGLRREVDGTSAGFTRAYTALTIHDDDRTPRHVDERVAAEGYAWPPLRVDGIGGASPWSYVGLHGRHAHHFASSTFGALHDFAVVDESDDRVTLAFCPRTDAAGASIRGLLTLVPGAELLEAEWRFETDEPDQGAGGAVSFRTVTEPTARRPHLVSDRGVFHRLAGGQSVYTDLPKRYVQTEFDYSGWAVLPTATHPCTGGLTVHPDRDTDHPDADTDPRGIEFNACVTRNWSVR